MSHPQDDPTRRRRRRRRRDRRWVEVDEAPASRSGSNARAWYGAPTPPTPPTPPMPPAPPAAPAAAGSGQRRRRKLTPEQKAYREARQAANRKIGFLAHAVPYACVCLFLLFVAGFRPAMIVAMSWGVGLAIHYFFAIIAPDLRQRMIDREVSHRVTESVTAERRSLEGQQAQRIEELSASIAHEIRNPITAAKSLVQQMGEDPAANDNVEYAKVALDELDRVERSVAHLLRFAREEEVEFQDVRLEDVVESAIDTFGDRIGAEGVGIETDLQVSGPLRADSDKLRRVLINLLGNALDAFADAGTEDPRLMIQAGENLAGTEIWVRVKDNGPGIDADRLERIFNPFYTSKASGTGLGLAISKKLVDAHGGSIEAQSSPGAGTEFVLTFPKPSGAPS